MSVGNLKDSGNQGNNFPWQLKMLQGLQALKDDLDVLVQNESDCCKETLTAIDKVLNVLSGYERTPNISSETGVGATPLAYSVSISNVGSAAAVLNGVSVPAGVTLNFDPGMNNTVSPMSFNATGTTLIIISIQ